jgi:hypothetical protein
MRLRKTRREVFNDIHPDCGGDGTRALRCGVVHHRARERLNMMRTELLGSTEPRAPGV